MKRTLLTLMTLASIAMAGDAHAQIGWTLNQCRAHWGKETDFIVLNACPPPQETRPIYVFHYGKRYIVVNLGENGKVIKQTITNSSHL
jgi:hypothetical protein